MWHILSVMDSLGMPVDFTTCVEHVLHLLFLLLLWYSWFLFMLIIFLKLFLNQQSLNLYFFCVCLNCLNIPIPCPYYIPLPPFFLGGFHGTVYGRTGLFAEQLEHSGWIPGFCVVDWYCCVHGGRGENLGCASSTATASNTASPQVHTRRDTWKIIFVDSSVVLLYIEMLYLSYIRFLWMCGKICPDNKMLILLCLIAQTMVLLIFSKLKF